MICVINICHLDRELALKQLRHIAAMGGVQNHDLILQSNIIAAAHGLVSDLEEAAKTAFKSVLVRAADTEDERGWPWSPNAAWVDMVNFITKTIKKPWLWLEPDAVPLVPTWLDQIEAEFSTISDKKAFMGGEVKTPQHRMSGVAVYPPWVAQFTRGIPALWGAKAGPWDQVLARDFFPYVHFTPLIQNIWNRVVGDPNTAPTFPDQESLSLIDPKAVIFHRCKDGSLIDRLNERKAGDKPCAPTQCQSSLATTDNTVPAVAATIACASEAAPSFHPKVAANRTSKKVRTPQEQEIINARMAKARAGRQKKQTA